MDGEPVDDEEDDNEDFIFTSAIDNMDISSYFLHVMSVLQAKDSRSLSLINNLQNGLNSDDKDHLLNIVKIVEERRLAAVAVVLANNTEGN